MKRKRVIALLLMMSMTAGACFPTAAMAEETEGTSELRNL